jgi:integrase
MQVIYNKLLKAAGVKYVSFHKLGHTFLRKRIRRAKT